LAIGGLVEFSILCEQEWVFFFFFFWVSVFGYKTFSGFFVQKLQEQNYSNFTLEKPHFFFFSKTLPKNILGLKTDKNSQKKIKISFPKMSFIYLIIIIH
jgi:hypothetical protein